MTTANEKVYLGETPNPWRHQHAPGTPWPGVACYWCSNARTWAQGYAAGLAARGDDGEAPVVAGMPPPTHQPPDAVSATLEAAS